MGDQPFVDTIGDFRSPILASIRETAEGLHAAGEIWALREREGASQAVFAWYLNVTTGLISQWERGSMEIGIEPMICRLISDGTLGGVNQVSVELFTKVYPLNLRPVPRPMSLCSAVIQPGSCPPPNPGI